MSDFWTIIAMGVITFAIRLIPFLLFERWQMPTQWQRALDYVPASVLMAIIVPEVLFGGQSDISPFSPRLLAAVVAIVIAWRWQNALLTVAVGMGVLWALLTLLG